MAALCAPLHAVLVLAALTTATWTVPGAAAAMVRAASEEPMLNTLLDNVLLTVQREVFNSGFDVALLPDVATTHGGLALTGTEGQMDGLSTIHRADTTLVDYGNNNGTVIISTGVSLRRIRISYRVRAKYLLFAVENDVGATITQNRVQLSAGIFYQGNTCYIGLQDVNVDILAGVQWKVAGFGAINGLVSAAINFLVPASTLKDQLNASLAKSLANFKTPCHNFLPGLNKGVKYC